MSAAQASVSLNLPYDGTKGVYRKAQPCSFWILKGTCKNDSKCTFSHNNDRQQTMYDTIVKMKNEQLQLQALVKSSQTTIAALQMDLGKQRAELATLKRETTQLQEHVTDLEKGVASRDIIIAAQNQAIADLMLYVRTLTNELYTLTHK